jgi:hypothetical protein
MLTTYHYSTLLIVQPIFSPDLWATYYLRKNLQTVSLKGPELHKERITSTNNTRELYHRRSYIYVSFYKKKPLSDQEAYEERITSVMFLPQQFTCLCEDVLSSRYRIYVQS